MADPKTDDPMVAALLRERASLVQRGLEDRVRQVDEQLALRGYAAERAGSDDPGDPSDDPPKGRKAPVKRTTASEQD